MESQRQWCVLCVDDVIIDLRYLVTVLQGTYRVLVATNGTEALETAHNEAVDIILLDANLPVMDGYEICRRLKGDPVTAAIPILFLTARHEDADEARGLASGAVDYIRKPINSQLLLARIHNQLELIRHRNHLETMVQERTNELEHARLLLTSANQTIAREIHDEFGCNLAAIRIALSLLERQQSTGDARQRCQEIIALVNHTQHMVQRIVMSLPPTALDYRGLFAALEWLTGQIARHSGLKVQLINKATFVLNDAQSMALFRIAQEAITNILRHAQASSIDVILGLEGDWVVLRVCDDGRGYQRLPSDPGTSFGIAGMEERARVVGGRVTIATGTGGRGTEVMARVPLICEA
ncbi:MAG: response regulator [Magnetococcales bacterium]|nr:response regulator [Magnetococcales bacterium]